MLNKIVISVILLLSCIVANASDSTPKPDVDKLYSNLKFENDQPSYMDTVVPLGELIGSSIPAANIQGNGKTDDKKYVKYIEDKTSFRFSRLGFSKENPISNIGDKDFLNNYILEPKNASYDKEKKIFSIELEHGRGKVYSATIRTSERPLRHPAFLFISSNDDDDFIVKKHFEYIESYLSENNWKNTNPIWGFFTDEHIFRKDNLEITYYPARGYAAVIKISRTDLPELNAELEKIHEEGIAFNEKAEQEKKENKFKD